jgi:chemotaxis signal transduction protein
MQIKPEETNPEDGQRVQQHLTFAIGAEEYPVSLLKVEKIAEYDRDTEILRTWEWIRRMSEASKANSSALEHNCTRF